MKRPYIAFYKGKQIEVEAETSYGAQVAAAAQLRVPQKRQYQITVMLADVEHSTGAL